MTKVDVVKCPDCGDHFQSIAGTVPVHVCSRSIRSPEDIKNQKHYTQYAIQPVDFIGSNNIPFLEGNIIKYVCRHNLKNGLEDLKKAQHYLEILIRKIETGRATP